MKKILITGAGGFLGTNLIKSGLKLSQYEFWAITSDSDKIKKALNTDKVVICPREWIFTEDFRKQEFYCAINCAYPRNSTGIAIAQGLDYIEKLFYAVSKSNIESIINISSQSVYDSNRLEPATEKSPICLDTPYAVGKYMMEKMLNAICADIPHTNIRLASLIGPQFTQRIINRLIQRALNGETLLINQSEQTFGFLDVKDAADGILSLLEIDKLKWRQVYNLGIMKAYSIVDIVDVIKEVFKEKQIMIPDIVYKQGTEKGTSAVSYFELSRDTGYKPCIQLKQSVEDITEYIMENQWGQVNESMGYR